MADEKDKKTWGTIEPGEVSDHNLADVYTSYNFAEAELIRDILMDNQIDCFLHKLHPSQFPMDVGKHGQIRVSVDETKMDQAREVLQEAIDADALSGEGTFEIEG
jgi:hypothetical protein